jgi:hypothetical protein
MIIRLNQFSATERSGSTKVVHGLSQSSNLQIGMWNSSSRIFLFNLGNREPVLLAECAYDNFGRLTRLRDGLGAGSAFYVRGPNGQVRWTVTGEGALVGVMASPGSGRGPLAG